MGQQLLLTSCIPHDNYIQTIATLQAMTGSRRPQPIATYTILTKPKNVFKPKFEPGKVNQIEQLYMKCITVWDDQASKTLDISQPVVKGTTNINVDRLFAGKEVKHWTLQIADIPNAGKNVVSTQNFYESTIVHHHTCVEEKVAVKTQDPQTESMEIEIDTDINDPAKKPLDDTSVPEAKEGQHVAQATEEGYVSESKDSFLQFIEDLDYGVVNQYWTKGVRYFHGDIVIEIFKVFIRDDTALLEESKIKLQLLDDSNAFQIKAYISFLKGTSVDIINKKSKELTSLQANLQNLFELGVPDRMCMDPRVARSN